MGSISGGTQRLCAWTGPVFMVVFFIGWVPLAGWLPPPSPAMSAEQVVAMYRDNLLGIRLGMVVVALASALLLTFFAAVSVQVKRMEGGGSVLAYAQLAAGIMAVVEFMIPAAIWEAASYRLDRSPEDTQLLHDLGWFPFFALAATAILQGVVIGVAVLRDRRPEPVFPRWAGYFNIWAVMLLFFGTFIVLVKDGPIAWNGLLTWWMELVSYFLWITVNTVLVLRAVAAERARPDPVTDVGALAEEVGRLREEVDRLREGARI